MTLTVTPSSGRVGAGSRVFVTCSSPTVHRIDGTLANFSTPAGGLNASALSGFAGDTQLQLGFTDNDLVANKLDNFATATGLADGAACDLQISAWDVSGTLLESNTFTGFLWDPVSQLPALLGRLQDLLVTGPYPTILDTINSNVQGGGFKFPLVGLLTPIALSGNPYVGGSVIDFPHPGGAIQVALAWEVVSTPSYVGGMMGVIAEANRRILQAVIFHSLLGGATFASQTFDSHATAGTIWFDTYDPTSVSVFIYPGYSVNFSWLSL